MLKYVILFHCSAILQLATSSESRVGSGDLKLFKDPISYDVESTVLLNELDRKDKEVSYKTKAKLNVLPMWSEPGVESLLKFELLSPHLLSRGKSVTADYLPMKSIWDSYPHSTFYAHWNHGAIEAAFLDSSDPIEIMNFKRSLISAFQFQAADMNTNETDVSGACNVQYEHNSATTVRKYKSSCRPSEWTGSGGVRSRRVARYTLDDERLVLRALHAEELHELSVGRGGYKARAWLRLSASGVPAAGRRATSLWAALGELPAHVAAHSLQAAALAVADPLATEGDPETELAAALAEVRAAEWRGLGQGEEEEEEEAGELEAAHRTRRLVRALRAAPRAALQTLLADDHDTKYLAVLCTALGLAGTAHTHAAATQFLRLRARDAPAALAHAYLTALAAAHQPQTSVVEDVLRLGEEVTDTELAETALLAGAAAAKAAPAAEGLALRARDALARSLARCKSDECRRVRVVALGNLRREDTVELLMEHAENGSRAVGLAALDALDGLLPALRTAARLERLERMAMRPRPLELRAAALDLLLRCSAEAPFGLLRTMVQLHEGAPLELLRLAWGRLHALADDHPRFADMMRLLPRRLRGWDVQAMAGTSSVLVRELGGAQGWRARLQSVQVASGGMLRRGRVSLLAESPVNVTDDVLSVEIWTRGLEAIAGNAITTDDEEEEADETSGGLALAVGGARARSVSLFTGQSELLGHLWAGTASEPTPVLRAKRVAVSSSATLPLLDGSTLRLECDALQALALDAAAQVSLWSRSARSQLELRTALAAAWGARVAAPGALLTARGGLRAAPRLHIEADLDFYDGNTLCVRVHCDDYETSSRSTLESDTSGRHVWRRRRAAVKTPGRTLALGRINNSICCVLTPSR